jgi:hypothetical protein
MKKESTAADTAWLRSLGFDDDLIDTASGTRMIRVIFGEGADEETWTEETAGIDRGFACVA